jgi:soluble lytic murein transglycosylase-like protein
LRFHYKQIVLFIPIFSTLMLSSSLGQQIMLTTGPDGRLLYTNMDAPIVQDEIILKAGSASGKNTAGSPPPHIEKLISQISEQHGVDPDLVKAVAKVESNYNPLALSYKGAQGLMQLIPGTARRFGVKNVYDAKQNIEGGVKYLKFLSDMFPDNLPNILAAYNAGENAVLKHGGIPPIAETQSYVRKITRMYQPKYNKKGTVETAQNESEKSIMRYMDSSGRVVYTNVENSF